METLNICGRIIPVVPQRHARLRHLLKPGDLQQVLSKQYSQESYRILSILIPKLSEMIPEHEWEGYVSQEARGNDEYDELLDKSPTTLEIVEAFEKAFQVGGGGRLGKIMGLVEAGGSLINAQQTQTQSLPPLPTENGESS